MPELQQAFLAAIQEVSVASGLDVIDLAVTKKFKRGLEWNFTIDNLTNKHYYETRRTSSTRVSAQEIPCKRAYTEHRAIR